MKNDGGPAFPRPTTEAGDGSPGMSLRDYFAGQALIGLSHSDLHKRLVQKHADAANGTNNGNAAEYATRIVVNVAYRIADAMLAAREVPNE